MEGDIGIVLEYMKNIRRCQFFFSIQVDENDLVTKIFWLSPEMCWTMQYLVMLYDFLAV